MTPTTPPDFLGLQVFTQSSAESEQEGGDKEAAKIFGDLHSPGPIPFPAEPAAQL